jgi:hypothetical protein
MIESRFISFKACISKTSLLEAKKPATMIPNRPPKPKIQAFLLFVPLFLCESVSFCNFFAETTRTSSDVGVPSRDCSGVREGESEDDVPKMRLRRPDMTDDDNALRYNKQEKGGGRCRDQQRNIVVACPMFLSITCHIRHWSKLLTFMCALFPAEPHTIAIEFWAKHLVKPLLAITSLE